MASNQTPGRHARQPESDTTAMNNPQPATPARRRPWLWIVATIAAVAAVAATVGITLALTSGGNSGAASPPSNATPTQDPETLIECSNVERAYNAWHWVSKSSMDWALVRVKMRIDDGEAFLTAVEGYKDEPALSLAVEIAEYNYELTLVEAGMTISGGADTSRAEDAMTDIEDAYEVFQRETCQ